MAKKTASNAQPVAGAESAAENVEQQTKAAPSVKAVKSATFETTSGHHLTIDTPQRFNGVSNVRAVYDGAGEKPKTLRNRVLTDEQLLKYINISNKEGVQPALKYIADTLYEHFIKDKEYSENVKGHVGAREVKGEMVGGRDIDYIVVEKMDDKTMKDLGVNKNVYSNYKMIVGIKGDKQSRVQAMMTHNEYATLMNRAETQIGKDKNPSIGAPVSKFELADRVIGRKLLADEQQAAAKTYDWGQFKLPEGVKLTANSNYVESSQKPGRVWVNTQVEGQDVRVLLSSFQSAGLTTKAATFEQALMANSDFRKEVSAIQKVMASQGQEQEQSAGLSR